MSIAFVRRFLNQASFRGAQHLSKPCPMSSLRLLSTSPKQSQASKQLNRGQKQFHASSESSSLTELQHSLWHSYLATGRGSAALFGSINQNHDGRLSKADVTFFLQHADQDGDVSPHVLAKLNALADDHALDLHEFQSWLVTATQDTGYVSVQPAYESSTVIGNRSAVSRHKQGQYFWNASTMNQSIRRMQYAVRGDVVLRADELAAQGREIIYTNIGNPHGVGQKPLSYFRQVLALCDLPAELGVDHPCAPQMFPADVLERARFFRDIVVGQNGTGSYTNSQGFPGIRKLVADFIALRDGHDAFQGDIYLTNGASSAIELTLNALISSDKDAILVPTPQYPIYSALITRLGGRRVGYELEEDTGWRITREELEKQLSESKAKGYNVRGLVIINPGNPTGQVMDRSELEMVATFCSENGIVLLADEVYQRNVYMPDKKFISAKRVAMETPGCEHLELISYHSTSKGFIGECGRRGGYMEMVNIDPYVQSQIYKLASSGLCSGVAGQLMTGLMVSPPQDGDESYELFQKEENTIFQGLSRRSKALVDGLNSIPGISCQPAEGAMYAFPKIELPDSALQAAAANEQTPDTLYALSLLEETGICVVPASGFGQKQGRAGFRTTFLPQEEQLNRAIKMLAEHHAHFCEKYSSFG